MKKLLTLVLVLALSAALLAGCTLPQQTAAIQKIEIQPQLLAAEPVAAGGVLRLKINPEIALHYDENGKVTKLEGRNPDGTKILEGITGYVGKDTTQVLEELVELIGKAGYFVEEADGTARRIVLELDPGSQVPHAQFLQDMAQHVKTCVESKSWVGEQEFEYPEVPAVTEPAATAAPVTAVSVSQPAVVPQETIPAGLCPVCADDDCNDGAYCDDAHEKAENLREYQRLVSGDVCSVCADPDCDDGKYCDDADEKAENQRENEIKKAKTTEPTTPKATEPAKPKATEPAAPKATTPAVKLCSVCGDDDCDDGKYCDDADEKAENLREQENRKNNTPCKTCGDYDCDDGAYCDDRDDRYERDDDDDDDDRHHGRHHDDDDD